MIFTLPRLILGGIFAVLLIAGAVSAANVATSSPLARIRADLNDSAQNMNHSLDAINQSPGAHDLRRIAHDGGGWYSLSHLATNTHTSQPAQLAVSQRTMSRTQDSGPTQSNPNPVTDGIAPTTGNNASPPGQTDGLQSADAAPAADTGNNSPNTTNLPTGNADIQSPSSLDQDEIDREFRRRHSAAYYEATAIAFRALEARWDTLYENVLTDYQRYIDEQEALTTYFADYSQRQRDRVNVIINPNTREVTRQRLSRHIMQLAEWEGQAHASRIQLEATMAALHDFDTQVTIYREMAEMNDAGFFARGKPISVDLLHHQLPDLNATMNNLYTETFTSQQNMRHLIDKTPQGDL